MTPCRPPRSRCSTSTSPATRRRGGYGASWPGRTGPAGVGAVSRDLTGGQAGESETGGLRRRPPPVRGHARVERSTRMTAAPAAPRRPGPLVRALARAVNSAVARFPWTWPLLRGPVRRFFDSVATGWDERVRSDSAKFLEPLIAALDRLQANPGRILDIGTGTGAAAFALADRYPDAEVVGIDVSAKMVAQAHAKIANLNGRVQFRVA